MPNLKLQTGVGGLPAAPNALALADLMIVGQSGGAATTGTSYRTDFTAVKALLQSNIALSALANAAAQYDIIGRKTAGAGAWEDCTRTDLLIAGTDLANIFTQAQTVQNSGFSLLTIDRTDDGATGPRFVMRHTSTTPANNDLIGALDFQGYDSALTLSLAGRLSCVVTNVTAGSYSAIYVLGNTQSGVFSGRLSIGAGVYTTGGTDPGAGNANFAGFMKPGLFTVGTLPAAGTAGSMAMAGVSDALAPAFGAVVAAGGAITVPVYSDGANWRVG